MNWIRNFLFAATFCTVLTVQSQQSLEVSYSTFMYPYKVLNDKLVSINSGRVTHPNVRQGNGFQFWHSRRNQGHAFYNSSSLQSIITTNAFSAHVFVEVSLGKEIKRRFRTQLGLGFEQAQNYIHSIEMVNSGASVQINRIKYDPWLILPVNIDYGYVFFKTTKQQLLVYGGLGFIARFVPQWKIRSETPISFSNPSILQSYESYRLPSGNINHHVQFYVGARYLFNTKRK